MIHKLGLIILCAFSLGAFGQEKDSAVISQMDFTELNHYYDRYGFRTPAGVHIKNGTVLRVKQMAHPKNRRFVTVYPAPSIDQLNIQNYRGRNVLMIGGYKRMVGAELTVLGIEAWGSRRKGFRVIAVAWARGRGSWWVEINDALKLGEVEIVDQ